jgi:hypothetical protein
MIILNDSDFEKYYNISVVQFIKYGPQIVHESQNLILIYVKYHNPTKILDFCCGKRIIHSKEQEFYNLESRKEDYGFQNIYFTILDLQNNPLMRKYLGKRNKDWEIFVCYENQIIDNLDKCEFEYEKFYERIEKIYIELFSNKYEFWKFPDSQRINRYSKYKLFNNHQKLIEFIQQRYNWYRRQSTCPNIKRWLEWECRCSLNNDRTINFEYCAFCKGLKNYVKWEFVNYRQNGYDHLILHNSFPGNIQFSENEQRILELRNNGSYGDYQFINALNQNYLIHSEINILPSYEDLPPSYESLFY